MTWQFTVNQTPANGGTHIWNFVSTLMLAGWTKPMDGGGTAGALGPGAVTNGTQMNASRAWVRMQAPDGNRELCIQRGSVADYTWWIKYSRLAHFITGGDKETMPTAADETNIWSTGTAGTHLLTISNYRGHCGADDAPPYGAYWLTIPNGGSETSAGIFVMDPVDSPDSLDPDPVVFGRFFQNADLVKNYFWIANASTTQAGGRALLGASYTGCPPCRLMDNSGGNGSIPAYDASSSIGTNPFSAKDDVIPLMWARRVGAGAAPSGWKGIGTVMKASGVVRSPADTLSVVGVRDYIYLAGVVFPWDGSVPVI